jgi:antitoxin (DNA-binding transcriptional repressor) of toxin-antitoxin stability system
MKRTDISGLDPEAQACVAAALAGEDVVITAGDRVLARVIRQSPPISSKKKRQLGLDAGKISIAEDFDAPMPELEALFYGDKIPPR